MKVVLSVLFFAIGFLLGQQHILHAYDPERLVKAGRVLAANAYLLGCVNGGKSYDECALQATDWYNTVTRVDGCRKDGCPYPRVTN